MTPSPVFSPWRLFGRLVPRALLIAVGLRAEEPTRLPDVPYAGGAVELRDWLLLGPYRARPGVEALDQDFLQTAATTEPAVRGAAFERMVREAHAAGHELGRVCRAAGADRIDFLNLFALDIRPGDGQGAVYAGCRLVSAEERDVWLLAASDDSLKVWLNGELRHSHAEPRPLHLYDDLVRLHLVRGPNFLLVKVANIIGAWELAAGLRPSFPDAFRELCRRDSRVLCDPVREQPQSLRLRVDLGDSRFQPVAAIRDAAGNPVLTAALGDRPVSLGTGLYHVELRVGDEALGVAPLLVNPAESLDRCLIRARRFATADRTAMNLETLATRWRILLQPDVKKLSDRDWQQKMLYTAEEMEDVLQRLERGEEAFRGVPGLHLRAFRSRIDGAVQHYRVFVPPGRDLAPLPLIVMLATSVSASRPFLESPFIANHKEAEALGEIAAGLGAAIVWTGYRCTPYGNPCEFTHLDEALAAVEADYPVDRARISLVGVCGSGFIAAMAADLCPRRFAAIGLVNPVLYRLKNRFDDSGEFRPQAGYRRWLQQTDPVDRFAAIPRLPVWIIHDGVDPDHGPLSHSVSYVELARAAGQSPRFDRVDEHFSSRLPMWRRLYAWLARQRRPRSDLDDANFAVATPDGPVSRAFAAPFIVVVPTLGDPAELAAGRRLADEFCAAWRRSQYGDCRVTEDRALTPGDSRAMNLVLVGNPRVNQVWGRLAPRLPILLSDDGLVVNGRRVTGRKLSIEAVAPNPEQPARKLVLIGAPHLQDARFGTLELAIDGWFDWAVWSGEGRRVELIQAERSADP